MAMGAVAATYDYGIRSKDNETAAILGGRDEHLGQSSTITRMQRHWCVFLLIAFLTCTVGKQWNAPTQPPDRPPTPATHTVSSRLDATDYRLPKGVRPEKYKIEIAPEYVNKGLVGITKFNGIVTITTNVETPTEEIHLNVLNLSIEESGVTVTRYPRETTTTTPPTTADPETTPTTAQSETTPTTAQSETTPTTAQSETTPTTAQSETTPTTAQSETTPTTAQSETTPTTAESETTTTTAESETTTTTAESETTTTTAESETTTTTAESETTPTTAESETTPTTAESDTTTTTTESETTTTTTESETTTTTAESETTTTTAESETTTTTAEPETTTTTAESETTTTTAESETTTTTAESETTTTTAESETTTTTAESETTTTTTESETTTTTAESETTTTTAESETTPTTAESETTTTTAESETTTGSGDPEEQGDFEHVFVRHRRSADEMGEEVNVTSSEIKDVEKLIITNREGEFNANYTYEIKIPFSGQLTSPGKGLYHIDFESSNGDKGAVLATQFEATFARMVFPCFDEPDFKATFQLSIEVEEGIKAISNTKEDDESSRDGWIVFKETPLMSTYLLAFVIYDEKTYDSTDAKGKEYSFQTWGRTELIQNQGSLSQEYGPKMLETLSKRTKISYADHGFEKMDQVAVRGKGGAMENWGLVIYGEHVLLFDQETGTQAAKKQILEVIAHELAHQWFGNLVTTYWWNTIWLNEGFADYYQFLVVNDVLEKWRMSERYVLEHQMRVMEVDADTNAPALTLKEEDVYTPEQISDHFGTITYNKGGSILRQMHKVLGDSAYESAIQEYLQEGKGNTAKPYDLFQNFKKYNKESTTGLNDTELVRVFEAWTTIPGYPVITVSRAEEENTYKVKQERYLLEGTSTQLYPVYLTWKKTKDTNENFRWLMEKETTVNVGEVNADQWVVFNFNQLGYYRVNYDKAMWAELEQYLTGDTKGWKEVLNIDKAAIIDNAVAMARIGVVDYLQALNIMTFLREDTDFIPWAAARNSLAFFEKLFAREEPYKKFVRSIVNKAYQEVGLDASIDEQDNVQVTHRVNVLSLACSAGQDQSQNKVRETLVEYIAEDEGEGSGKRANSKKDPNIQTLVYCYGLKKDDSLWDRLFSLFKKSTDASQRDLYISSLGCSNSIEKLNQYLEASTGEFKDKDFAPSIFSAVVDNPDGVPVAVDFLKSKTYGGLEQAYGTEVDSVLKKLAGRLTNGEELIKFTEAVGSNAAKFTEELAEATKRVAWVEKNKDDILNALEKASSGVKVTVSILVTLLTIILAVVR